MIEVMDVEAARVALAAGRLSCPSCGGMLRPWGHTRDCTVLAATGTIRMRLYRPMP